MEWVHSILSAWSELLVWVAAFFVVFSVLAKFSPCNPKQGIWRKDLVTDLFYCFIMPLINRVATVVLLAAGIFFLFHNVPPETIREYMKDGFGPLARMPIWVQAASIILLSDFLLYWLHRWFHGKAMWRFHAIHHSAPHVDWLSAFRFHPINSWLSFCLVDASMLLLGFSPAAIATMAGANMIYSSMVHANLNWTFGSFRYLFASPVFHRWHHTSQKEGMDKNFAPTFPLLDILFGTFYMPEDRVPERFGVAGSKMPQDFLGQMAWPFKQSSR